MVVRDARYKPLTSARQRKNLGPSRCREYLQYDVTYVLLGRDDVRVLPDMVISPCAKNSISCSVAAFVIISPLLIVCVLQNAFCSTWKPMDQN